MGESRIEVFVQLVIMRGWSRRTLHKRIRQPYRIPSQRHFQPPISPFRFSGTVFPGVSRLQDVVRRLGRPLASWA